jgi:flagellar export protein FliJ
MKRQRFRLGSVLKHYELQKQRAEFDLQHASRLLRELDDEIVRLNDEIASLAAVLSGNLHANLSVAAWMACQRNAEHLIKMVTVTRSKRDRQVEVVAKCAEQRKRWAVAEETLLSLRRSVDTANRAAAAKDQQLQLDEAVLRRWLGLEADEDVRI